VSGAVLANVAFTALGSVFNYPDVLKEPGAEVLARFRDNEAQVSLWFTVLAVSSALLAPIAIAVGRLARNTAMRIAVPAGVAAAIVQVVGLSRWPLLVPGFAADAAGGGTTAVDAVESFATANRILGNVIGETFGYIFTAIWTVAVVIAVHRRYAGTWFSVLGIGSAALVISGVLSPLDLPLVDLANFIGYIAWSLWLIVFAVALLVAGRRGAVRARTAAVAA
jgi:hypothetical protein